jgi:CHAT domain-containing protein
MNIEKWLIAGCLVFASLFVQAETQQEQLELAQTYSEQAVQLAQQELFEQALPFAEKAYNLRKKVLGDKHLDTLKSLNDLAFIYTDLGRFSEALPLSEKAYFIAKEVLVKKDPFTFTCIDDLAFIHKELGQFSEALPLYEEAYSLSKDVFGKGHRYTLESLTNLTLTHMELDRFLEALPLSKKAYSLSKDMLGEKHQYTLAHLSYLAFIHNKLEQFSEALPLYEKAYSLGKDVFGKKHRYTLESLTGLVLTYMELDHFSEALPLSKKAYSLAKDMLGEKHQYTLEILSYLAFIYQELERFSEALPLLEKAYFLTKEVLTEKHPLTLTNLANLADIYSSLGRFSEALPLSEKAYFLRKEELGEKHPDTLTSLNNLASIYDRSGSPYQALPLSEKAYSIAKEMLDDKYPYTIIVSNLASLYMRLERFSESLPLYEKAYFLIKDESGEKDPNTLNHLADWAFIYIKLGRFSEALPLSKKACSIRKEVLGEKHLDTVDCLVNLALIYKELGHFSESLLLHEKAYSLRKEILGEKHAETIDSLANLAAIYGHLGRFFKSLLLHEKAYSLRKEVLGEKHIDTIDSLVNLAIIYNELDPYEALPLSEKAYFLTRDLGDQHPGSLLNSLTNLASVYNKLGRFSEALSLIQKAYSLSKEVLGEKHPDTVVQLANVVTIIQRSAFHHHMNSKIKLDQLDSLFNTRHLFEKAYSLSKEVFGEKHPNTIDILLKFAIYLFIVEGDLQKFEDFVLGVESLRPSDLSAENRRALFEKWVQSYLMLSDLYIDHSRPEEAFRMAEMSKARTLLESLAAKLAAQQSGLTTTEQQQLQDYEARLAFLSDSIAKALENNRLEKQIELEAEKNQLVSQFNQFHQQLMEKYPKYAQLSEVQIVGAKEGAKYLPADAVLISYLVDENYVLAFTLQADGTLTAHQLGEIPELENDLVTDYRDQLFAPTIEQGSQPTGHPDFIFNFGTQPEKKPSLSLQLGQQLLGPLYDVIKDKKHWIISPSGPLALIPFETLRVEGDEKPPVIAKHKISYVQSLSVLKLLQERGTVYKNLSNRGQLLAMGAPLYQHNRAGTTKGDPSPIDFNIASRLAMRGGDYGRAYRQLGRDNWTMLPGALTELQELETVFKDTKPLIYKQADATEAKLQQLNQQGVLAQHRYLVFSAHGYLSQVPALSAIVLGQVNNPPGIDGYVTAGEWPGYDLKSDLMVLSACETGLGEVVSGEGVMGLPYAFYVAGNKNTILTLWNIDDDVTVEFITSFFKKLKTGIGQIDALTATKREFLNKGGRYSNPKYWAAFVLYGV